MLTIYHNPRCSKSRQTLQIIQDAGAEVEVVEYLKTPLDKKALKSLTKKLSMSVRDIVRTSEAAYKEQNLKDDTLTEDALLDAIVETPKLMQRPIVVKDNKAVIGRPPENVLELING